MMKEITYIGLMQENDARREIRKLINLLQREQELTSKITENQVELSCIPIQLDFIREQINITLTYLRRWGVKVRVIHNDSNKKN